MNCPSCGRAVESGKTTCPYCGAGIHYGGKTEFYGKASRAQLSIRDFFTDAFKQHPKGSGARMFMAGTPSTTPTPDRMLQEWDKPWLFVRVILVGLLFGLLSYFMGAFLGHIGGIYLLFSLGALIMPIGVLTFFWEISIPRDIPIYRVAEIFLLGGMLSLIFTLLLPSVDGPALLAPLTEEPGKVIATAIFISILDSKYIFDGLLIGAAVGAGFSAFENIFYVMTFGGVDLLISRSIYVIGGHVAWAAIEGGALMIAKGAEKLRVKHFFNPTFVGYLALTMLLHGLWNSDITVFRMPILLDVKYVLLTAAAVVAVFSVIKKAIKQLLLVVDAYSLRGTSPGSRSAAAGAAPPPPPRIPTLSAVSGPLAGKSMPLNGRIVIGRDASACNLVIPDAPYISRRHCAVEVISGSVYVMDLDSTYGTFLQPGQRLPPNQWVRVRDSFYLVKESVRFRVIP